MGIRARMPSSTQIQTPSDTRARTSSGSATRCSGERRGGGNSAGVEMPTRPPESAVDVKIDFKPAAAGVVAGSFGVDTGIVE